MGLNEAAYASELVRAGILSVDHGQTEAAYSVGLNRLRVGATSAGSDAESGGGPGRLLGPAHSARRYQMLSTVGDLR